MWRLFLLFAGVFGVDFGPKCTYNAPKINLTTPGLPIATVLLMQKTSLEYSLSNGDYKPVQKNPQKFRHEFVDTLLTLTKNVCPRVAMEFLHILNNFLHLYLNELKFGNETKMEDFWRKKIEEVKVCFGEVLPTTLPTTPKAEKIDSPSFPSLDLIIESLWFQFQISLGTCASSKKLQWLVNYFFRFQEDWLNDELIKRWTLPSPSYITIYGPIFGNIDIETNYFELRACARTAFIQSHAVDRQLARPLFVMENNVFTENYFL